MKVAIFGSRAKYGPEIERVQAFVRKLAQADPSYVIVSGGEPTGVDNAAEQEALRVGLHVISLRPFKLAGGGIQEEDWRVQRWELGGPQPYVMPLLDRHPGFANFDSAATYRDMLIVEEADRGVAFHYGRSPGTAMTIDFFHASGKPVHVFTREE